EPVLVGIPLHRQNRILVLVLPAEKERKKHVIKQNLAAAFENVDAREPGVNCILANLAHVSRDSILRQEQSKGLDQPTYNRRLSSGVQARELDTEQPSLKGAFDDVRLAI